MEVVVTAGAVSRVKLQTNCHQLNNNKPTPIFLQATCPPCHPTNSVKVSGPLYNEWKLPLKLLVTSSSKQLSILKVLSESIQNFALHVQKGKKPPITSLCNVLP